MYKFPSNLFWKKLFNKNSKSRIYLLIYFLLILMTIQSHARKSAYSTQLRENRQVDTSWILLIDHKNRHDFNYKHLNDTLEYNEPKYKGLVILNSNLSSLPKKYFTNKNFWMINIINHSPKTLGRFIKSLVKYNNNLKIRGLYFENMSNCTIPKEFNQLKGYSEISFSKCNKIVFEGGLPPVSELIWFNNCKNIIFPTTKQYDTISRIWIYNPDCIMKKIKNIDKLINLKSLDLLNRAGEAILPIPLKELSLLKNLNKLAIAKYDCSNPNFIHYLSYLQNLSNLFISDCNIECISADINNLSNLKSICLAGGILEIFPSQLLYNENLTEINLMDNKIKTLAPLILNNKIINLGIQGNMLNNKDLDTLKKYLPNAIIKN